jgi:hypothetical protein
LKSHEKASRTNCSENRPLRGSKPISIHPHCGNEPGIAKGREEERTVVRTALQGTFGLSLADTEELVRLAETEKHPLEEHLIRRVAGLLHVPHPDFIDAKARARGNASIATGVPTVTRSHGET